MPLKIFKLVVAGVLLVAILVLACRSNIATLSINVTLNMIKL